MSEEKEVTFKVSDRRIFNPDGTLRTDIDHEEEPETPTPPPVQAAPAAPAPASRDEAPWHGEIDAEPVNFSEFLLGLGENAMMLLGVDHPQYGPIPPDLPQARHIIDVLGILQEKTRNNLTREEDAMLGDLLKNLRMRYLALARRTQGR